MALVLVQVVRSEPQHLVVSWTSYSLPRPCGIPGWHRTLRQLSSGHGNHQTYGLPFARQALRFKHVSRCRCRCLIACLASCRDRQAELWCQWSGAMDRGLRTTLWLPRTPFLLRLWVGEKQF